MNKNLKRSLGGYIYEEISIILKIDLFCVLQLEKYTL